MRFRTKSVGVEFYYVQDQNTLGRLSYGLELGMDKFRLGLNHLGLTYIRFRANVMGKILFRFRTNTRRIDLVKVQSWERMSPGSGLNQLG